jgi:hypothetical protein
MSSLDDDVIRNGRDLVAKLLVRADRTSGEDFNNLLSLFFRGLPMGLLGELLQCPDKNVIRGSLFIAEELAYRAAPVLDLILPLLNHEDAAIRYCAYSATASCASRGDPAAFSYVVVGMRDADAACRKIVMLWMMRVDDSTLASALRTLELCGADHDIQRGLQTVLGDARDDTRIKELILDETPLARKFGLIAAGRAADKHPALLKLAAASDDSDLQRCAAAQLEFTAIRRKYEEKRLRRQDDERSSSNL